MQEIATRPWKLHLEISIFEVPLGAGMIDCPRSTAGVLFHPDFHHHAMNDISRLQTVSDAASGGSSASRGSLAHPSTSKSRPVISKSAPVFALKKIADRRKRFQPSTHAHETAMILDAEGTIRYVTPAARRLLHYGPEEPLMPCFFSHIHGQNIYQVMRDIADMVCYGKPKAGWLLRIRTGRGNWQWFRTTVTNQLDCEVPTIKVVVSDPSAP